MFHYSNFNICLTQKNRDPLGNISGFGYNPLITSNSGINAIAYVGFDESVSMANRVASIRAFNAGPTLSSPVENFCRLRHERSGEYCCSFNATIRDRFSLDYQHCSD